MSFTARETNRAIISPRRVADAMVFVTFIASATRREKGFPNQPCRKRHGYVQGVGYATQKQKTSIDQAGAITNPAGDVIVRATVIIERATSVIKAAGFIIDVATIVIVVAGDVIVRATIIIECATSVINSAGFIIDLVTVVIAVAGTVIAVAGGIIAPATVFISLKTVKNFFHEKKEPGKRRGVFPVTSQKFGTRTTHITSRAGIRP
jgi:hypothetical protein